MAEQETASSPWHAWSAEDVYERLESGPEGLDEERARERLDEVGPNELPREGRAGLLRVFLRQFGDPL
ncbi:MAG TPA: cation-transporting P-type ATPase, partial [Sandaracinaceae bacterium LLY-WYZ-13_1]|nr:cation-transporting P-type ATPase [Sandaracinaceae bacterium LLY-WYZ-13_1]